MSDSAVGVPYNSDFPSTEWAVVNKVAGNGQRDALAKLCREYYYPIYSYVRRITPNRERSRDLTQKNLCCLLRR